jgi:hypothetical protein
MPRILTLILIFLLLALTACQKKELLREAYLKSYPEEVRLITSDVDLFWQMYDNEVPLFTDEEIDQQYLKAGTPALSFFLSQQKQASAKMSEMLNSWIDRMYYKDIRNTSLHINDQKGSIAKALKTFQLLYPEAVFTDIVFVMGALTTGGTVLSNGQIVIAAEMFSKTEDIDVDYLNGWLQSVLLPPDALPVIIIHELVHVQQRKYALALQKQVGGRSLLDRALLEGGADFVTKLVLDRFLNEKLLAYGDKNEEKLWKQFSSKMQQRDFSDWLYNGSATSDRPADLGYYIGYKIAEQYYKNAEDKRRALRKIIEMKNPDQILQKSGYAESF